jgi:hypothetical protein
VKLALLIIIVGIIIAAAVIASRYGAIAIAADLMLPLAALTPTAGHGFAERS